jgi:hypothetical protein
LSLTEKGNRQKININVSSWKVGRWQQEREFISQHIKNDFVGGKGYLSDVALATNEMLVAVCLLTTINGGSLEKSQVEALISSYDYSMNASRKVKKRLATNAIGASINVFELFAGNSGLCLSVIDATLHIADLRSSGNIINRGLHE